MKSTPSIQCQNCRHIFLAQEPIEAKVAYVGCSNLFKLQFEFKTTCEKCLVQLRAEGQESPLMGVPYSSAAETIVSAKKESGPTIKVKIGLGESAPEAATKVKPFKILSQTEKPKIQNFKAKITPSKPLSAQGKKNRISKNKFWVFSVIFIALVSGVLVFASARSHGLISLGSEFENTSNMAAESLDEGDDDIAVGGLSQDVVMDEETMSTTEPQFSARQHVPEILNLPKIEKVTSGYGIRLDPFTRRLAFHGGIDFKTKTGDKVFASLDGVVSYAGRKGKYGNLIKIAHPNGYETRYAHLSKIKIQKGQHIKKGQLIGLAGSTGRSTGPHLHFELLKNNKKVDPLSAKIQISKNSGR